MSERDDVPSWEEVARRYGRKIYSYAYRLAGNPDDASDLTQDVLLRVRKGLVTFTRGSFEAWLWRITHNTFIDGYRRRTRHPTVPLADTERGEAGTAPPPEDVLATYRLGEDVQAALLELPLEFREAVVLCDVVGLTYQEIADAAGVPIGTVRSRIYRGRSMLRSLLS